MGFIIPLKRTSISGSTFFSKYKTDKTSKHFLYQTLKEDATASNQDNVPISRIITKGDTIFYEIAHGDSTRRLRKAWHYLTRTIEPIISELSEEDGVQWLIAHCTKITLDDLHHHKQSSNGRPSRTLSESEFDHKDVLSEGGYETEDEEHHALSNSNNHNLSQSLPLTASSSSSLLSSNNNQHNNNILQRAVSTDDYDAEESELVKAMDGLYLLPTPSSNILQSVGIITTILIIGVWNCILLLIHTTDDDTFNKIIIISNITILLVMILGRKQNKYMITIAPITNKHPYREAEQANSMLSQRVIDLIHGGGTKNGSLKGNASKRTNEIRIESNELHRPNTIPRGCWDAANYEQFNVRMPNYKQLHKKGVSLKPIMELAGVDVFNTPLKVDEICKYIILPKPINHTTETTLVDDDLSIPKYLIINFQMPRYAASLFSKDEDGDGFSLVFYFTLTGTSRDEIKNLTSDGGIELAKKFFSSDFSDQKSYMNRLKAIPHVNNAAEIDLGYTLGVSLKKYNAKPWLTGPTCHRLYKGKGYVEIDIDFHIYAYPARKGLYSFFDYIPQFITETGFVIEGREEEGDVLPERLLCAVKLIKIDINNIKNLIDVYPEETKLLRKRWTKAGLIK